MKTNTWRAALVLLTVSAGLAGVTAADDNSPTLQQLQQRLDEQTRRVDRLYQAFGPQLTQLEREAAEREAAERAEKVRSMRMSFDLSMAQGNYEDALRLLAEKLKTEQSELGPTNAQTLETLRA